MQLRNAGSGLKKVFICQIVSAICTVILLFVQIQLINHLVLFLSCVFLICKLIGLNEAINDIKGCKIAFCLAVTQLVLMLESMSRLWGMGNIKSGILIAIYITDFLTLYFVCSSVAKVLSEHSYEEIAAQGKIAWKMNLVFYAAKIIVILLPFTPILRTFVFLIRVVTVIVSLDADIQYISFLYKSYKVL